MKQFCCKRRHTLSGRLVILFLVAATLTVALLAATLGWAFRGHFEESVRPHLDLYLEYIQQELGEPPRLERARELSRRLNMDVHYLGEQTWSTGGRLPDARELTHLKRFEHNGFSYGLGHSGNTEYLLVEQPDYRLVFTQARHVGNGHMWVVVAVILFILILLYHAIRFLFRPIETIRNGVERIGAGELDYRLDIQRKDELGALGESINTMADDIRDMLDAKRQLLLAISHELRTPLTRAKLAVEMLEEEKQRKELHRELDEMVQLIEELLETERLGQHHAPLSKNFCDLSMLIQELIANQFPDQEIKFETGNDTFIVEVDIPRIKLLLKNLLDNALRHTPAGAAPPGIVLQSTDDAVNIYVNDHGEGIGAEHLDKLSEPFYRVDSARQRQTGGYGLGLYLCRKITEAHGGRIQVNSVVGTGTTVQVSLPK